MFIMFQNLMNTISNKIRCLLDTQTGDMIGVENTGRHRAANPDYYAVRVRHCGDADYTTCYLFTLNELRSAETRAKKNPEDVPWCDPENCECGTKS